MSESYFAYVEFQILAYAMGAAVVAAVGLCIFLGIGKLLDWVSRSSRLQASSDAIEGENRLAISKQESSHFRGGPSLEQLAETGKHILTYLFTNDTERKPSPKTDPPSGPQ